MMPPSLRARAPLRRLLESHHMKLVGGLLLAVFPLGRKAGRLAVMPAGELAQRMSVLPRADQADRLKRRGFYVDLDRCGISKPSQITGAEAAAQLDRARRAAASAAIAVAADPAFEAWLEDPPAEVLELIGDLVTALAEAKDARTPDAAAEVIRQGVEKFRAQEHLGPSTTTRRCRRRRPRWPGDRGSWGRTLRPERPVARC